jgi:hypothetical protein
MAREVVITLPDEVYEALRRRAGQDDVSSYIEQLVRPDTLSEHDLEEGYRAMAADTEREREALEWIELEPGDALP